MTAQHKIRVLIVEDSLLFSELLLRGLALDPQIQVVATARDPFVARDMIIRHHPDVMTCDIEMPRMNGIEFIRRLLPQYPLPIVVVSSLNDAVFDAMNAGAIDFIGKPDGKSVDSVERFLQRIIAKIKVAAKAKVLTTPEVFAPEKIIGRDYKTKREIIAIGASTGGTNAIHRILKQLSPDVPGIVVSQHIPSGFSTMFAARLNETTGLNVKEARTGDPVERGRVLIAPGDQHMLVRKKMGRYYVVCVERKRKEGISPSVDVLFESVAEQAGREAIGVILTGMGRDGAEGLLAMRKSGADTIGQDEKTSVVYGMPKAAFNMGAVETQLPLDEIPKHLHALLIKR